LTILAVVDGQFITLSSQRCLQHEARSAARRAGPSTAADALIRPDGTDINTQQQTFGKRFTRYLWITTSWAFCSFDNFAAAAGAFGVADSAADISMQFVM